MRRGFAVVALSFASRGAAAAECGRADLQSAFPADGARSVPLNATLSAVYAESADYLGEPVRLSSPTGEETLEVAFDTSERRLSSLHASLAADTTYTIQWPALRGLASAGHGSGRTVTFTTSSSMDVAPPDFAGITGLSWDLVHPRDDCTDDLEERYRFDLKVAPALDDSGNDGLALLVFQTRGPALEDGAPRLLALRNYPSSQRLSLELPVSAASGRGCFAALARDLVGATSASGANEWCVEPAAPPFFYGCSLGVRRNTAWPVGALLFGMLSLKRRSGRRRSA